MSQHFCRSLWFVNFLSLCHVPLVCITCFVHDLCAGSSVVRCSSNRGRTQEQVGKDDGVAFHLNNVNNWAPSRLRRRNLKTQLYFYGYAFHQSTLIRHENGDLFQRLGLLCTLILTAVKRKSMRNALVPGRRPRKFPAPKFN